MSRIPSPRSRSCKKAFKKYAGNPTNYLFYTEILATAEAAGLTADEVGELIKSWQAEAEPYGPAWLGEVRLKALKALGLAKPYAEISLQLAQETDKELGPTANLERRAAVAGLLAYAAKLAGKADIAKEAEARAAALESQIDHEYEKKVPPFHPEAFAGRKNPQADSVVLVELFTGVQCPPCVGVDVAFDALLQTYKPTEVIGLQHHLHIPRPDPLANNDTQARQEYFGDEVAGTPYILFNGQADAEGGGTMADAEARYKQFREVIDKQLESKRGADIKLSASHSGDEITIHAQATLANKAEPAQSRPRLRLALTEKTIRYVGTNKLRFHHQVVRSFPGGLEGKDLSSGQGRARRQAQPPGAEARHRELSQRLRQAASLSHPAARDRTPEPVGRRVRARRRQQARPARGLGAGREGQAVSTVRTPAGHPPGRRPRRVFFLSMRESPFGERPRIFTDIGRARAACCGPMASGESTG